MYDIAIIGSGPAGANLARLIGDKYKVLLLDKRGLDQENSPICDEKCCGGLLAPDAQKIIAKLCLGIPKDILVNPQLFAVRAIDIPNKLNRLYQRFYINMDRNKFDKWLVSLLPAGVETKYNAFYKNCTKIPGGYEIRYIHNGFEEVSTTRILVGADGANSMVRKYLLGDVNLPVKYISIQEWFECSDGVPYYTAIFDEEISDFYSWIIPKEGYLILGSALSPGKSAKEKFDMLKMKVKQKGFGLNGRLRTESAFIYRPRRVSQFYTGRDGIALIGEAAGAISPSSAEGISYALKSSLYLAQSLEDGTDGFLRRYKQRAADIKLNLLLKNLKSPAMYNPVFRQIIMKSGLRSIR